MSHTLGFLVLVAAVVLALGNENEAQADKSPFQPLESLLDHASIDPVYVTDSAHSFQKIDMGSVKVETSDAVWVRGGIGTGKLLASEQKAALSVIAHDGMAFEAGLGVKVWKSPEWSVGVEVSAEHAQYGDASTTSGQVLVALRRE